jgi:hypothetical protein
LRLLAGKHVGNITGDVGGIVTDPLQLLAEQGDITLIESQVLLTEHDALVGTVYCSFARRGITRKK